ncbi:MAG: dihydropteroate synthase [Steroidobacteraceae bacterium]
MQLICSDRTLDLSTPAIMGVLNVTPDSFSDGGRYTTVPMAVERARMMVEEGARIIDVGGESTRPGAAAVTPAEEIERVTPVIEALRSRLDVLVSVDTRQTDVAKAALEAGAHMINDVSALSAPDMIELVSRSAAGVCLMHKQGEPRTMQVQPKYGDVVREVKQYLAARIQACEAVGIARSRIVIDPGIGFGKTLQHNLALIARLTELQELGVAVLIGVSRKSMFKTLLGRELEDRLPGTVATTCAAVLAGAAIVRTHDVAAAIDASKVAIALREAGYKAATARSA